jgi:hypothetical protein
MAAAKGELLPRCDEPVGIEVKLRNYLLVLDHEVGGSKANGFITMLGIDLDTIGYLAAGYASGSRLSDLIGAPQPDAVGCAVDFQIAGVGRYSRRRAWVRTAWRLDGPDARPRFSIISVPTDQRELAWKSPRADGAD